MYELLVSFAGYADKQPYCFMDLEKFNELVKSEPLQAQQIYWQELAGRAHFAATSSAVRHLGWLNGCLDAIAHNNYLAFCATFRGLLESAADSYEALHRLPAFIATNGGVISKVLKGEDLGKTVTLAPQLEESLIHFSHARAKLDLTKESPDAHRAQTIRSYLSILDRGQLAQVHDCYSELCEVCHPSAFSVLVFVNTHETEDATIWVIDANADETLITEFLARYNALVQELMMFVVNPILMTLYVPGKLPCKEYKCDLLTRVRLNDIPLFRKLGPMLAKWTT